MIIYAYETVPQKPGGSTHYYLIKQNPGDDPLPTHPKTAEPIRRVVLGELGELVFPDRESPAEDVSGTSPSCGCCRPAWLR